MWEEAPEVIPVINVWHLCNNIDHGRPLLNSFSLTNLKRNLSSGNSPDYIIYWKKYHNNRYHILSHIAIFSQTWTEQLEENINIQLGHGRYTMWTIKAKPATHSHAVCVFLQHIMYQCRCLHQERKYVEVLGFIQFSQRTSMYWMATRPQKYSTPN